MEIEPTATAQNDPPNNNEDATSNSNSNNQTKNNNTKSALQDNIERKGANAYYFAHSHKATGPAWDGKAEPRLLSQQQHSSKEGLKLLHRSSSSTFDYAKSNITSYGFLDEPTKVKLFIDLPNVGEQCTDDDLVLEYTEQSFSLTVRNYNTKTTTNPSSTSSSSSSSSPPPPPPCLCFARLSGKISSASVKRKDHRIILTLIKAKPDVAWHTINDKGTSDHDVV